MMYSTEENASAALGLKCIVRKMPVRIWLTSTTIDSTPKMYQMLKFLGAKYSDMCLRYTGIMPGARSLTQSITVLAVRVMMFAMAYAAPALFDGSTPMTTVLSFSKWYGGTGRLAGAGCAFSTRPARS